jgi:hypothetical protein
MIALPYRFLADPERPRAVRALLVRALLVLALLLRALLLASPALARLPAALVAALAARPAARRADLPSLTMLVAARLAWPAAWLACFS